MAATCIAGVHTKLGGPSSLGQASRILPAMPINLILNTDSYKASHWLQYPPGMDGMFSYIESRGGLYGRTVFFGLQTILKEYLTKPVTLADIEEARALFTAHGEPFNEPGWHRIVHEYDGRIPVTIRAAPEGSIVPVSNVLATVESTDAQCLD